MLKYTLPGLYSDTKAAKIKEVLEGKTYYRFMVEYGGIAGNNEISVMSTYMAEKPVSADDTKEFTEMVIYYAFNCLA